jgi:hypothetical protein
MVEILISIPKSLRKKLKSEAKKQKMTKVANLIGIERKKKKYVS